MDYLRGIAVSDAKRDVAIEALRQDDLAKDQG